MKQALKLWLSLLVRASDALHDTACRLRSRPSPPRCVVLYYHSVSAGQRERFARQMDLLLQLAHPVSTDPTTALEAGKRYAAVTFDDGFVSVLQNAAPELKQRQLPWTFFIPSGKLGQNPDWLRHANGAVRQERVLSADELRVLSLDPLVTIGSHTVSHANLLELGPEDAARQLADSKNELEAIVQKPVSQFSYPFGVRSPGLDQQARQLGYRRVFSSDPVHAFQTPGEVLTGRASVDPDISRLQFRLKVLGAYRWQGRLAWRNRKRA